MESRRVRVVTRRRVAPWGPAIPLLVCFALGADNPRPLIGSWTGRATAPDGGPPSGDIELTISRGENKALKGKLLVKAQGGLQYSGEVSNIALEKKIFSATAVFKLGENPIEANVKGPLKGTAIQGNFTVISKGEKIGEGTFNIQKLPPPKKK